MQATKIRAGGSGNTILAGLSGKEFEHLRPHMQTVNLPHGSNIYNFGDTISHVYFPLDAVVCLFTCMEDGATAEAGLIGAEGMLGVSVLFGAKYTPNQAVAINAHYAVRIRADIIKREFDNGGLLHNVILRYMHSLYVQISQISACDRIHHIECRLCRWLLMAHDRTRSNELFVTQEFISQMLGTRRPYVTTAAGILQKDGIINCSRGKIEILDRHALEERSCECYGIIQDGFVDMHKTPLWQRGLHLH
ncbi:MAG: Crp/Fnr family transcriptional regulator [Pyrinomonadaceae bacterium]